MFCPKCNYTSFDHLPTCPKCAFDWSEQKKIFNMEWMVPAATEGINIFKPSTPGKAETTEQPEGSPKGSAAQVSGTQASEEEISLEESDLEPLQGEASLSGTDGEQSDVDEEIESSELEGVFSDPSLGAETSSEEEISLEGEEEEPVLDIEIDELGSAEEEATADSEAVDQDDLDLDLTSILDDIEGEEGENKSGKKKQS
ncbi:MAG: hypothetical protein K9K39_01995 [Desulfohalobiaceae bacterium]|nr:hypothetical protein [Desulfohalobiaceae bacterium]